MKKFKILVCNSCYWAYIAFGIFAGILTNNLLFPVMWFIAITGFCILMVNVLGK